MKPGAGKLALRMLQIGLSIAGGILLVAAFFALLDGPAGKASAAYSLPSQPAAPIPPPDGYPKFILSNKTVSPSLALPQNALLHFRIEIINTGAYTGYDVTMVDPIPANTTFIDASSNVDPPPLLQDGLLTWNGDVGFDSSAVISFNVAVDDAYQGTISNTAVISHAVLQAPLLVSSQAQVTEAPLLEIQKSSFPPIPGPNKPLTYTLTVTNRGQPASNLPLEIRDRLPVSTTLIDAVDGFFDPVEGEVGWNPSVTLATGESADFVFTVLVGDVPSGTVIANEEYRVEYPENQAAFGQVYTTTILDPELYLYKKTDPFPAGSNRELTYTLVVLNKGSLATGLVVSDTLPLSVTFISSEGNLVDDTVIWSLDSLDTGESAEFSFKVYIGDIAEVPILNGVYRVCSSEGVCADGLPLTNLVKGPTFEVSASLDPIAKKPGGGTGPVTPTLTLKNIGPGNALDALATLYFGRISVSENDLLTIPPEKGKPVTGPVCGDKCVAYQWVGDLSIGEIVTFTTIEGQSTIGGEEGTNYTATIVVTDTLGSFTSNPITATAIGTMTHFANLIPKKSAPPVIGAGQMMTYTIRVFNSGLSTDVPPYPTLVDTVPPSTTLHAVYDGGISSVVSATQVVSWTLPAMSPGDVQFRSYAVLVDSGLVSGSLIVNDGYFTTWSNAGISATVAMSNTGEPITTVVREVGLIDSFKTVTPTILQPGTGNVLTYTVHVVNSGPFTLTGVHVSDLLPWEVSTYQRDGTASSGQVISDIVSLDWTGDLAAFSEERITMTVMVDPNYIGPVTNTAVISHTSLLDEVVVQAVSYVTDKPVLRISKTAFPDPVKSGGELTYQILVENLGQQATNLIVTDTLPASTSYLTLSASGNGQLLSGYVFWQFPVLPAGESELLSFQVTVYGIDDIINDSYRVTCAEGASAQGAPVTTRISTTRIFLPVIRR